MEISKLYYQSKRFYSWNSSYKF